ncbi:MAG: hypothetical protein ACAH06_05095 [Methylophilaceae bacterium]
MTADVEVAQAASSTNGTTTAILAYVIFAFPLAKDCIAFLIQFVQQEAKHTSLSFG